MRKSLKRHRVPRLCSGYWPWRTCNLEGPLFNAAFTATVSDQQQSLATVLAARQGSGCSVFPTLAVAAWKIMIAHWGKAAEGHTVFCLSSSLVREDNAKLDRTIQDDPHAVGRICSALWSDSFAHRNSANVDPGRKRTRRRS